ncbi:MAG: hypothetical protein ACR2L2_09640 [Acidobacteriota bacterium]
MPPQSTLGRFLASLHLNVARQILVLQRHMRERVWSAANVKLADVAALRHTTLATARLRFLFIAAQIWRHAGRTGVHYSNHYEAQRLSRKDECDVACPSAAERPLSPR